MIITPNILTNDAEELKNKLFLCEGVVNHVQIDINDGTFLGVKTIEPEVLQDIDTNLSLDFHLMVKEPARWVEKCVRAGADRIIAHIEHMSSQSEYVKKVQEVRCQVGLALDFKTSIELMDKTIINDLDTVLLMSYPAGKGGQVFSDSVLTKIKDLSDLKQHDPTPFMIYCDGAIWTDTISKVASAGADEVTVGKKLFEGDIEDNINKLSSLVQI